MSKVGPLVGASPIQIPSKEDLPRPSSPWMCSLWPTDNVKSFTMTMDQWRIQCSVPSLIRVEMLVSVIQVDPLSMVKMRLSGWSVGAGVVPSLTGRASIPDCPRPWIGCMIILEIRPFVRNQIEDPDEEMTKDWSFSNGSLLWKVTPHKITYSVLSIQNKNRTLAKVARVL